MTNPVLIAGILQNVDKCPQCGVINPLMNAVHNPSLHYKDGSGGWYYATLRCSKCKDQSLYYGYSNERDIGADGTARKVTIFASYPAAKSVSGDIPDRARSFLQQAVDSLHAPDGAVMLAASSVDAMLKDKGYKDGTLFSRITKAYEANLLTEQMRDWAHEIRLSANEPRHADDSFQGATNADAKQVIEFAEALGEYLYVLPARVKKWQSLATTVRS